jgi:hypothetical protein
LQWLVGLFSTGACKFKILSDFIQEILNLT